MGKEMWRPISGRTYSPDCEDYIEIEWGDMLILNEKLAISGCIASPAYSTEIEK